MKAPIGRFTFTKRTNGKIVLVEKSNNMFLATGASYIRNHFFRDTQSVTTFYLGLIQSTTLPSIVYIDRADNVARNWREEKNAGNRQIWTPALTNWPNEINNSASLARWTMPPGMVGSITVRGAFLTHDDATPYTSPVSSNTGKNDPFAASFTANAFSLDKNDTLDVEYSLTFD